MFEAKSLFTPLKLVAAILLDDVLGAYPFLLLPDEWFYFLMNQAYFLMNVSASPRSVSGSGSGTGSGSGHCHSVAPDVRRGGPRTAKTDEEPELAPAGWQVAMLH